MLMTVVDTTGTINSRLSIATYLCPRCEPDFTGGKLLPIMRDGKGGDDIVMSLQEIMCVFLNIPDHHHTPKGIYDVFPVRGILKPMENSS